MPDIRLIALDMDGTVLNTAKEITPRTVTALCAAMERGVEVVPVTGRTISGIPEEFMRLPGLRYAIGSNGATVQDLTSGKILAESAFALDQALDVLDIVARYDSILSVFIAGNSYTRLQDALHIEDYCPPELWAYVRTNRQSVEDLPGLMRANADRVEKFSILYRALDERDAAEAAVLARFPDIEATHSLGCNLELNPSGVHKGRGLAMLAARLGLTPDQVMACGDSGNDLAMIEYAGLGVAMGNAEAAVKAAAQYITLDNDHDGVAAAVEKFVLG